MVLTSERREQRLRGTIHARRRELRTNANEARDTLDVSELMFVSTGSELSFY